MNILLYSLLGLSLSFLIIYYVYNKVLEKKDFISPLSINIIAFSILLTGLISSIPFLITILAACAIGIVVCRKYQKEYEQLCKPIAIKIAVISLILSFTLLSKFDVFGSKIEDIRDQKKQFDRASAVMLGKIFAKKCPNSKALIIVRRGFEKEKRKDIFINALKEGFGDKVEIDSVEYIDKDLPKNTPEGVVMSAKNFDKIIENNKDCEVVISTIGLPLDIEKMKIWEMKEIDRPKLGLLNVRIKVLRQAIRADYISAAVWKKPNYRPDPNLKKLPEDLKKTFDLKYLMITPENIDNNIKGDF